MWKENSKIELNLIAGNNKNMFTYLRLNFSRTVLNGVKFTFHLKDYDLLRIIEEKKILKY
jgi:hypothetical protein